jgi:SAM-dependent methyltransferase
VRAAMPICENSVDIYQSEDVFEHIPYEEIPGIFNEIFRVLKSGGLFRLSLPDYRCELLADRTVRNSSGDFVFDPGGGGKFVGSQVVAGGHLWFPTCENVQALFARSKFSTAGKIDFLHYTNKDGESVLHDIDYSKGFVGRTPDHDNRVRSPRRALSIVVDAFKKPI